MNPIQKALARADAITSANNHLEAISTGRCDYDSGSMTGCQPLCDKPATQRVDYRNGSYAAVAEVCDGHVRQTIARAYPSNARVTPLEV